MKRVTMLEDSARYYSKKSRTVAGKDWCLIYKAQRAPRKVASKYLEVGTYSLRRQHINLGSA